MPLTTHDIQSAVRGWLKDLRATGETEIDKYSGKRKEPRFYPWCEAMEVRFGKQTFIARGENLSREGIGFTCKTNIPRGSVAEMRRTGEETWIPIRVQHCTQSVGVFKIGAKFIFTPPAT